MISTQRLIGGVVLMSGLAAMAGCQTIIKTPHAISCDLDAKWLNATCAAPAPIADDMTFQGLVHASLDDRKALSECGVLVNALRESINRCNQTTEKFNKKIDEINAQNKAKD